MTEPRHLPNPEHPGGLLEAARETARERAREMGTGRSRRLPWPVAAAAIAGLSALAWWGVVAMARSLFG